MLAPDDWIRDSIDLIDDAFGDFCFFFRTLEALSLSLGIDQKFQSGDAFAKEIVEATARRTAQEFITMGGEKRWNRPVYIQISPLDADRITLRTNDPEIEVNVVPVDGIIQETLGDAGG